MSSYKYKDQRFSFLDEESYEMNCDEFTKECVERGASLLDQQLPGWASMIDVSTLELSSSCNCVAGQLGKHILVDWDEDYRDVYNLAIEKLGVDNYDETNEADAATSHGFECDHYLSAYSLLQKNWIEQINKRLDGANK